VPRRRTGEPAVDGYDAPVGTCYGRCSAKDLPFLWQPTPTGLIEQARSVVGALPPSPLTNFNPEYITSF